MPFTNRDKTMYKLITDVAQELTKNVSLDIVYGFIRSTYAQQGCNISKFLIFDQDLSFKNARHICVALRCLTAEFTMYIIPQIENVAISIRLCTVVVAVMFKNADDIDQEKFKSFSQIFSDSISLHQHLTTISPGNKTHIYNLQATEGTTFIIYQNLYQYVSLFVSY